ncbi:MAG: hypothetical protein IT177_18900 [Acidobacteria bacterium]|nr:hypothetical protein [Acidobacteriota bacterium]
MTEKRELVVLRGGDVVPADAFKLVFDLEARGLWLRVLDDAAIELGPRHLVTDADRAAVRRHYAELRAYLERCTFTDLNAAVFSDEARDARSPTKCSRGGLHGARG